MPDEIWLTIKKASEKVEYGEIIVKIYQGKVKRWRVSIDHENEEKVA